MDSGGVEREFYPVESEKPGNSPHGDVDFYPKNGYDMFRQFPYYMRGTARCKVSITERLCIIL